MDPTTENQSSSQQKIVHKRAFADSFDLMDMFIQFD